MEATEQCISVLGGSNTEEMVSALRQLSNADSVSGVTSLCVVLAGHRDDEVRMWAAEALQRAVVSDETDVPQLAEHLRDPTDGEIAYWAATMLGRLGVAAEPAVDALESCINNSSYLPARERAAWALSCIGPSASSAMETLQRTSQNAPPRLKRLVIEAIEQIGRAAA